MIATRLLAGLGALLALAGGVGLATATTGRADRRGPSVAMARSPALTGFDEHRAYDLVRLQLAFGPRPAGSAAERRAADVLVRLLPGGHFEPVPGGLRNIVGGLPGRQPAIVLGAHYDTTPVPGYLGANNSAAGVGAVIEIARDLAADRRLPGAPAIRFVLFDGEEAPAGFTDFLAQGLRGSRAYVAAHASTTREMVLLDFIALRNEMLPRELGSNAALWARLRSAAAQVGTLSYFPPRTSEQIYDDHTSFSTGRHPGNRPHRFRLPLLAATVRQPQSGLPAKPGRRGHDRPAADARRAPALFADGDVGSCACGMPAVAAP